MVESCANWLLYHTSKKYRRSIQKANYTESAALEIFIPAFQFLVILEVFFFFFFLSISLYQCPPVPGNNMCCPLHS